MSGATRADRYLVVPAHVVRHAIAEAETADAAIEKATRMVERDRVARAVVRVLSKVSASPRSRVEIVRHMEVANGAPA